MCIKPESLHRIASSDPLYDARELNGIIPADPRKPFDINDLTSSVRSILKRKFEKKLSEKMAARFMYETLSAISYCHSKGIVHRDLKPQNLLLTSKDQNASIKVIDFGIADKLNSRGKITEVIGTVSFI